MAQKRRFTQNKRQAARSHAPDTRTLRRPPELVERARPVVYGKPFVLVEDAEKNTFVFKAGEWVAYSESIAECRQTCLVKELPQRVNGRIRYEVRIPETEGLTAKECFASLDLSGAAVMVADIVISANFSDDKSRILAGPSEERLEETSLTVSDVRNQPLNAVKALGRKSRTAVVICRVKDDRKGWSCTRKHFRRVRAIPPTE